MNNRTGNIVWGILFIAAGIILGGRLFNLWTFSIFFEGWWTLFIIIPCAISILTNGINVGSIFGLLIGVALLLNARDILPFNLSFNMIVPLVLVWIGVTIIFGGGNSRNGKVYANAHVNKEGLLNFTSVFSGQDTRFDNEVFPGAIMTTVFGGIELDLRHAVIEENVEVKATVVFGGIDIFTPDNVNIKINSTPIFGGATDESKKEYDETRPTLFINATCVFGGIEVR